MLTPSLFIAEAGLKGRCVFTRKGIAAHTIIEVSPVIVLSKSDRQTVQDSVFYYYLFEWGVRRSQAALGLGYISLYNHDDDSNCQYFMDYEEKTITVKTVKRVKAGDELTINYSAGWSDWQPYW